MRVKTSELAPGLANAGPGQCKICKCPTPGTDKACKCPALAWGGGGGGAWTQVELTDALPVFSQFQRNLTFILSA